MRAWRRIVRLLNKSLVRETCRAKIDHGHRSISLEPIGAQDMPLGAWVVIGGAVLAGMARSFWWARQYDWTTATSIPVAELEKLK